jgi:hypothetical protein
MKFLSENSAASHLRLIFMGFAFGIVFIPAVVRASEIVTCMGDMPVFAGDGIHFHSVVGKNSRFSFRDTEIAFLRFGVKANSPYIEVSPWGHVTFIDHSAKFAKDLKIEFNSDAGGWFGLRVTGRRTGISKAVNCNVRMDEPSQPNSLVKKDTAKK